MYKKVFFIIWIVIVAALFIPAIVLAYMATFGAHINEGQIFAAIFMFMISVATAFVGVIIAEDL